MNRAFLTILLATLCIPAAFAQERPGFQALRYDEDYTFLRDPQQRTLPGDWLKYIPLSETGTPWVSLGGEARVMGESFRNEAFSRDPLDDNSYLLQRYLLHLDAHASETFRVFTQFQSAFEAGKPGDGDENTFDLHQLFADGQIYSGADTELTLRVGRQELRYGSERLIGVREGTNNRRAFDAVRLLGTHGRACIDAFFSSPVEWDAGAWDDQHVRDTWLWGTYATLPLPRATGSSLDLYYLGHHQPNSTYSQGRAREERHTLGARIFGTQGNWEFNHEGMYQFGKFGSGRIRAWTVATDHTYALEHLPWRPRLGLRAAVASGDRDPLDADLESFNALYPRGNYFSEASLLGPRNFIDVRPSIALQPERNIELELSADAFWRQSRSDGIYHPSGALIYSGDGSGARYVGTDISLSTTWQASRNITVGAAFTHFISGSFIRDNGGISVNYAGAWVTFRF